MSQVTPATESPIPQGPKIVDRGGLDGSKMTDSNVNFNDGDTPTEPSILQSLDLVIRSSEENQRKWEERCKKETVTKFASPFDPAKGRDRVMFPTVEEAETHSRATYPRQHEAAELTKQPVEMIKVVIPPKPKLTDFYPPETAAKIEAAIKAQQDVKPLLEALARDSQGNHDTIKRLLQMTGITTAQLTGMSEPDIQSLGMQAYTMGKMELSRACRRELGRRGLPVKW